jgi:hypothetical protein
MKGQHRDPPKGLNSCVGTEIDQHLPTALNAAICAFDINAHRAALGLIRTRAKPIANDRQINGSHCTSGGNWPRHRHFLDGIDKRYLLSINVLEHPLTQN